MYDFVRFSNDYDGMVRQDDGTYVAKCRWVSESNLSVAGKSSSWKHLSFHQLKLPGPKPSPVVLGHSNNL